MKIATWNVNSIRSRQTIVSAWLAVNPVDALCLQETKVEDQSFPRAPFEELGYHLAIAGQKAYNGVAIFSRVPLEDVIIGFEPLLGDTASEFSAQQRVIAGVLNGVRLVNLYVPNGASPGSDKYEYKLRWLAALRDYLLALRDRQPTELCVCGDFNVAPEDRDIYKPEGKQDHIMATPAEREALQKVLSIGLQDALRKFTSDGGLFTWWDYRQGGFSRDRGWRIDHHYLTSGLYAQATGCTIDREPRGLEKPSDHTPVIVELVQDGGNEMPIQEP
ncbi:MAG: exodeoxyribonuclease III [Spirulinaceae cyanobacterium SM2_1_0]|nr:exodeoxyribonuclease III [Spirulinaceae cyanobacterium SM2_1_0]